MKLYFNNKNLLVILSLLGIILTTFLTLNYFENVQFTHIFCDMFYGHCDALLTSRWAVFPPFHGIGVPISILGFCHFSFLFIWFLFIGTPKFPKSYWHLFPTIQLDLACLFSGLLIIVMKSLNHWCILCILVHFLNFIIMLLITISWFDHKELHKPDEYISSKKILFIFILDSLIFFITFSFANQLVKPQFNQKIINIHVNQFFQIVPQQIPIESDDPIIQPSEEKYVTIIIFMDLHCHPCQLFNDTILKNLQLVFNKKLKIVYKYHPLCLDCNSYSTKNKHPFACDISYLAEAIRLQGNMEKYEKAMILLRSFTKKIEYSDIVSIAKIFDLNPIQLNEDFQNESTRKRITNHIYQGKNLGVNGTPTVYLEGRLIDKSVLFSNDFWMAIFKNLNF